MLVPTCLAFSVPPGTLLPVRGPEGSLDHQETASLSFQPGRIQVNSLYQEMQASCVGRGSVSGDCVLPCSFVGSPASDSCVFLLLLCSKCLLFHQVLRAEE